MEKEMSKKLGFYMMANGVCDSIVGKSEEEQSRFAENLEKNYTDSLQHLHDSEKNIIFVMPSACIKLYAYLNEEELSMLSFMGGQIEQITVSNEESGRFAKIEFLGAKGPAKQIIPLSDHMFSSFSLMRPYDVGRMQKIFSPEKREHPTLFFTKGGFVFSTRSIATHGAEIQDFFQMENVHGKGTKKEDLSILSFAFAEEGMFIKQNISERWKGFLDTLSEYYRSIKILDGGKIYIQEKLDPTKGSTILLGEKRIKEWVLIGREFSIEDMLGEVPVEEKEEVLEPSELERKTEEVLPAIEESPSRIEENLFEGEIPMPVMSSQIRNLEEEPVKEEAEELLSLKEEEIPLSVKKIPLEEKSPFEIMEEVERELQIEKMGKI